MFGTSLDEAIAGVAMVRYTLSHIVLPLAPIEQTASEAAELFTPYLDTAVRPAKNSHAQ